MNFDQTVLKCFEKEEDAKVWQYHPEEMFERYDRHFKRMEQVEVCIQGTANSVKKSLAVMSWRKFTNFDSYRSSNY